LRALKEKIEAFYTLFEEIRKCYLIATANIWNVDESGIQEGRCSNTRVLAAAGRKRAYVKLPTRKDWISILAVSADGQYIRWRFSRARRYKAASFPRRTSLIGGIQYQRVAGLQTRRHYTG
jgi:hypothetical protein